jgi:YD repeat-containing protein
VPRVSDGAVIKVVMTDAAGSIHRYGYDAVNNRTSVTDTITGLQRGVEISDYDALDRVTRITQRGNGVAQKRVDMSYDAASQMTG